MGNQYHGQSTATDQRPGWFLTLLFCVLMLGLVLSVLFTGCGPDGDTGGVDIVRALSEDADISCYERAEGPKPLVFPRDLGAHEGFKTEWWYYTGNLTATDPARAGRTFGFQLTFFRQALDCQRPEGISAWRTRQLYFAHFAITDVQKGLFYPAQRMNRGSIGLAGAQSLPFKVWIDEWSAGIHPRGHSPGHSADQSGGHSGGIRLKARDRVAAKTGGKAQEIGIDLVLGQTKPPVLQGDRGWSRKGPGDADASYYYSYPGMEIQGHVLLGDESFEVEGQAWFDHEWSTAALGEHTRGWDWFALHLTAGPHAGTDLMVCEVRQARGPAFGFGSLSRPDGTYVILNNKDFSISVLDRWTSPASQKTYPARWRIRLLELNVTVTPVVADQEHPHDFAYYEGAVRVTGTPGTGDEPGTSDEDDLLGRGYVEMTGY